jgi:transposase-like protein
MKKNTTGVLTDASAKTPFATAKLEMPLPLLEVILETRAEIEALSAQAGLKIMARLMDQEIAELCGPWGSQKAHRHGSQSGYVVYAGRKVTMVKPRVRDKDGKEVGLRSYQLFQGNGRMQKAVARKLLRQVSTRNYRGAIDECLEGYGIQKSSVSRHWKEATAAELAEFCQRPVPSELAAMLIDSQYFRRECLVVALGVDRSGAKHVLGLWHGATENATLVRTLLADLRERGLNTESPMLVVIDGAKALAKGVREVFGDRAFIQRCRVHKLRNVMEHLPKEKRAQVGWRLRGAWAKPTVEAALKELRTVVKWLETLSPSAARSLEEGLEETLTVTRLGLEGNLARSFSSTNLIESCFARTEAWTRRVKHWRDAKMVLRWGAAALLVAEKGFRRVRGCDQMDRLLSALSEHQVKLASQLKAA